jgi:hypothetical protein
MSARTTQTTGRRNRWPQVVGGVFRMVFWAVCGVLAVVAMIMIQRAPQVRAAAGRGDRRGKSSLLRKMGNARGDP